MVASVNSVAFSQDGQRCTVRVWDATIGHSGPIYWTPVVLSSEIASAGTIRLRHATRGQVDLLGHLFCHNGCRQAKCRISLSQSHNRVWDATIGEVVAGSLLNAPIGAISIVSSPQCLSLGRSRDSCGGGRNNDCTGSSHKSKKVSVRFPDGH
jgi:hypothetical protein